jgi:putative endonuclease
MRRNSVRRLFKINTYGRLYLVVIRRSRAKLIRYFSLGARGERAVVKYLRRNFYFIWEVNYRASNKEIDIIASKARRLVFIEVKTRRAEVLPKFSGLEAVTVEKQRRILSVARRFVRDNRCLMKQRRILTTQFDIAEVRKGIGPLAFDVRYFEKAF